MRMTFRRTVRNADYVVYVSEEFLQRRYPTKGRSIALSDVEIQDPDPQVLQNRLNRIHNMDMREIRIGTAGAIDMPFKGQKYVIEALALLKKKGHSEFKYYLAGGGDPSELKRIAMHAGIQDQVIFEGSIPHSKIADWMDNLDIYIQPSLTEGLPRALVEAMSRGLPAIGSDVGGIPELLDKECVFHKKKPQEIASFVLSLSKEKMIKMAEHNHEKAKAYQKRILDERRYEFYSLFKKELIHKQ